MGGRGLGYKTRDLSAWHLQYLRVHCSTCSRSGPLPRELLYTIPTTCSHAHGAPLEAGMSEAAGRFRLHFQGWNAVDRRCIMVELLRRRRGFVFVVASSPVLSVIDESKFVSAFRVGGELGSGPPTRTYSPAHWQSLSRTDLPSCRCCLLWRSPATSQARLRYQKKSRLRSIATEALVSTQPSNHQRPNNAEAPPSLPTPNPHIPTSTSYAPSYRRGGRMRSVHHQHLHSTQHPAPPAPSDQQAAPTWRKRVQHAIQCAALLAASWGSHVF